MVLEPFTPKFLEQKKKLEQKIRLAVRDAVDDFEKEVGIYCTDIDCKYHKDQKMLSTNITPVFKIELDKGIH